MVSIGPAGRLIKIGGIHIMWSGRVWTTKRAGNLRPRPVVLARRYAGPSRDDEKIPTTVMIQ